MADDIWSVLNQTYIKSATAEKNEQQDTITYGYKTDFKQDLDIIQKFAKDQKSVFKDIAKEEAKLHQLSLQYKRDIYKQESQHYNNIYNLKNGIHKKEVSLLEKERNIRQQIAETGKSSLSDLAELYNLEKERERNRRQSLEYQEGQYKKTMDSIKSGISKVVEHFFKLVNDINDLNVWNNWSTGLKQLGAEYEKSFTEIAGRIGSSSQVDAHNFIKSPLLSVNASTELTKGLNFNNEVFPAITEAVQKGFTKDAEDIAISNAIDKKIMPWLETSSETWVQMQYNMSDEALLRYKSDQLMLQATQEGNRLLQTGVISQITDSILPSLDNIVANTTEVEDLNDEMYAKVMYLMNDMGYSKQEAIKAVNKEIAAYQNPFKALTSGDTGDKLLAIDNLWGTDLVGNFASSMIGSGWAGSGAFFDLTGLVSGGETRTERGLLAYSGMESAQNKYIKQYNLDKDNSGQYDISKLLEYTTATQQNDNKYQNDISETAFDSNLTRHGIEIQSLILDEVHQLKTWLFTTAGALLGTLLADKITDGLISKGLAKIGGKLFTTGGGNASILGSMGGGGVSGTLPTASTSAFASSSPLLSKLGGGLATGAGGSTAAGLATLSGAAAGIGMAAYGGYQAYNEFSQIGKGSETDEENKNHAVSGGLAAGGAAAGAVGAGALLAFGASNPVGWAALAIGGVALGIKAIYDHNNRLSGLAEQYEAHGEELKSAFQKEQQTRIEETAFLKQNILSAKTDKDAQNEIINSGLLSEKTARDLTTKELSTLTTELIKTESAITALGNAAIDAKTKVAKEEAQQQTKDVLDTTYNNIKTLLGKDNVVKEGDTEYAQIKAMFEGMASSITNDEERKLMQEQLNTMFAEGEFDLEELKVLMNKGGNWRSMWHTTIDRKRNFYDYAMDVESANASLGIVEGNGSYDLGNVNIDQNTAAWQVSMDEWYKTYVNSSDAATKEAAKNKFLDIWNTNIKSNTDYYEYLQPKYKSKAETMGITGFKLGSTYIPSDMLAILHAGERVLTAGQNKEYTEELISGNSASSIIQAGVQDIVIAIKTQTTEIINYLSTVSFNNSSFGNSQINMLPAMGNTKVTI